MGATQEVLAQVGARGRSSLLLPEGVEGLALQPKLLDVGIVCQSLPVLLSHMKELTMKTCVRRPPRIRGICSAPSPKLPCCQTLSLSEV